MDISKTCYFLITGASRGIGQAMAIECCKNFKENSLIVLIARSDSNLQQTKHTILEKNAKINVKTFVMDLSKASTEDLSSMIPKSLEGYKIKDFELAFIIHNAGSLGNIKLSAKEISDINLWNNHFYLNVFSVAALNNAFMKQFVNIPKLIVNITSKCGIEPFKSLTLYCSAKAAREMYFRVLASEEPDTVVLNYSPGPVATDMTIDIEKNAKDGELREIFRLQRENNTILKPIQTTLKFLEVLKDFKFKSGDHIDYYD